MKTDFSKNIIDTIKSSHISTHSRYSFLIKNWGFLIWAWISFFIYSLLFGLILYYWDSTDWNTRRSIGFFKLLFVSLPFLLIFFLLLSTLLWIISIHYTKKGYKYRLSTLLFVEIFWWAFLWLFFLISWVIGYLDNSLKENFGVYKTYCHTFSHEQMITIWQNPDKWLLIWEIKNTSISTLFLIDSVWKNWEITLSPETIIKEKVTLESSEKIKILWNQISENTFFAKEVRPMYGKH